MMIKTSLESYLIFSVYLEICSMEVYVLTSTLYLVKLPVNVISALLFSNMK